VIAHHLQDLGLAGFPVGTSHNHLLVGREAAAGNAAHTDDAHIAVVVQRGNLHLEIAFDVDIRCLHVIDDHLEQRGHVVGQLVRLHARHTVQGRGVDDREIELLVGGAQTVKQVEHLVHGPVRTGAGAVNLVHYHNRVQAFFKGLAGHEAGLGHGAVDGVYQQQHRVHHGQYPLDLTAEVGVSGGVHDVDAVVIPANGRVLGQNGNAAFTLLIVGIHDPLGAFAASVQGAGLGQQFIDQGGFAVVNVGDNGDVTQILNSGLVCHENSQEGGLWKKAGIIPARRLHRYENCGKSA